MFGGKKRRTPFEQRSEKRRTRPAQKGLKREKKKTLTERRKRSSFQKGNALKGEGKKGSEIRNQTRRDYEGGGRAGHEQ